VRGGALTDRVGVAPRPNATAPNFRRVRSLPQLGQLWASSDWVIASFFSNGCPHVSQAY
jgi:hypothetical protein